MLSFLIITLLRCHGEINADSYHLRFPLTAAVAILKRLNRLRVTMGVDGYMFRLHPTYSRQMIEMMASLMPRHMTVSYA